VSLEQELGEVGGLHIDGNDDCRRWTVLLSLDHSPPNTWPGRTLITALRVYAVMAPLCALIFRGVQPHLSLPPIPMGDSQRAPWIPSVPELMKLDIGKYIYARLKVVNYPKESLHERAPAVLRTKHPVQLNLEGGAINGLDASLSPEELPEALAAFGTKKHQHTTMVSFFI